MIGLSFRQSAKPVQRADTGGAERLRCAEEQRLLTAVERLAAAQDNAITDLPDGPLRDMLSRLLMRGRRDRHTSLGALAAVAKEAIGGIEGEIRVCMQYFFQAWGNRAPTTKYRDMLLNTATEELGHIEMLATAVAMNLENAPTKVQEAGAADAIVGAVMGGENPRHIAEGMLHKTLLSTGMAAFPGNSDGLPFDMSHIYASGNIAADMYCNVAAESTGRVLAVRLYNATNDAGMRDMWSFLIARDTMHQQQWLSVIEELGGAAGTLPIPNSFPQSEENQKFNYNFFSTSADGSPPPAGRWTQGPSLDGKGEFSVVQNQPMGEEPVLGPARPDSGAQSEQIG